MAEKQSGESSQDGGSSQPSPRPQGKGPGQGGQTMSPPPAPMNKSITLGRGPSQNQAVPPGNSKNSTAGHTEGNNDG